MGAREEKKGGGRVSQATSTASKLASVASATAATAGTFTTRVRRGEVMVVEVEVGETEGEREAAATPLAADAAGVPLGVGELVGVGRLVEEEEG